MIVLQKGDDVFMTLALTHFWYWNLGQVIREAEKQGFDRTHSRFSKIFAKGIWYKESIRVWLARYYRPVSNMMFDGKSPEQAFEKWKVTKACNMGDAKRPNNTRAKHQIQAAKIGSAIFANGWLSKHDWKTCK